MTPRKRLPEPAWDDPDLPKHEPAVEPDPLKAAIEDFADEVQGAVQHPPLPPLSYDPQAVVIPDNVERWAKDQAIEAALADQDGKHDGGPLDGLEQSYERVKAEILSDHDSPFVVGPDDEIITHAQAILPHIGPEATVAYLMGAISKMERS